MPQHRLPIPGLVVYMSRQLIGKGLDKIITMVNLQDMLACRDNGLHVGINKVLGHDEFFPKNMKDPSLRMKRMNRTRPSGITAMRGTLVLGPSARGVKLCSSMSSSGVFPLRQL